MRAVEVVIDAGVEIVVTTVTVIKVVTCAK